MDLPKIAVWLCLEPRTTRRFALWVRENYAMAACHIPERLPCTSRRPLRGSSGTGHVPPTGKREWYMLGAHGIEPWTY